MAGRVAAPVRAGQARRPVGSGSVGAGQQLPARVGSWGRQALHWVAAGIGGFGAAPLLGRPGWAWPALAAGLLAAVIVARRARRAQLRGATGDRLAEALAPLLGLRAPDRSSVQLRSWTGGRTGAPRRIDVIYAPGVDDADPQWLPAVLQAVERRLQQAYQLRAHDRRRCRLSLEPAVAAEPPEPVRPLQARAERTVLELLGPTGQVTGVQWDGEDLIGIDAQHTAGARLSTSGYRHRVERVVSTLLPGRWRAQWHLEDDTVRFELRPTFPASVWLPVEPIDETGDLLSSYDQVALSYGVDEDGTVMRWRPAHDPNVILVGAPGTGKTVTAHTLLVQATRRGWPVWVVDGKSVEFLGFQDWPNVQIVATSIEQQVAVITRAWEVMELRYRLVTSGQARERDFEPLLVFLDEFADFRGNLTSWYAEVKVKGDPSAPLVLSRVASLARKGRTSRVHLIFGTQRPDASYFGTGAGSSDMRDNFRMRISMGRLSPQGAMMMWESPAIGTSIPKGCRGRATTIDEANRPVEIQTYRTPDPRKIVAGGEDSVLLERLRPSVTRHERLLILPPAQEADKEGELLEPTYSAYAATSWVLASSRPELDPVLHRQAEGIDGRSASSPMSVFGLTGRAAEQAEDEADPVVVDAPPHALVPADPPRLSVVRDLAEEQADDDLDDAVEGYGPVLSVPVSQLKVGDLLLVDEDTASWAVVDEEVEPDLTDDGCLAVSWRDDDDDCGVLSMPDDELVLARSPVEADDPSSHEGHGQP